jgi:uncharacterized coiled-coil DUF342 family protein
MQDDEGRRRREEFARLASDPSYFQGEVEALEHDLRSPAPPEAEELRHEVRQLRAEVQELREEVRQLRARLG